MAAATDISPGRVLTSAPRRRAISRTGAALGAGTLAGMVVASVLFALSAAGTPSFYVPASLHEYPAWLAGPLEGLAIDWGRLVPLLLLVAMFACWVALLRLGEAVPARLAIGSIVALHLVFLLGPVLLSTDLFGYLAFGRLEAAHGLSPYTHAVEEIPNDPINPYLSSVWPTSLSTPYGPLFVLATSGLSALGIPAAVWSLKVLTTAAALGAIALAAACARRLGRSALAAAMFVGLNPLWLAWAVGGVHNDLLMGVLMMSGAYLVIGGREALGSAAIVTAGVGVKATAGLVLPFVFLASGRRLAVIAGAAIGGIAIALLAFVAMGQDLLGYLPALSAQADHLSSQSVPQAVGHLLGVDGVTPGIKLGAGLAFAATVAALLVRAWRTARWIEPAGWAMIALLLTSSSLHPWYIVGLAPLAAISDSRALRAATVVMTALLAIIKLTP
jgi:alpha-1,6-mannosyltransferase